MRKTLRNQTTNVGPEVHKTHDHDDSQEDKGDNPKNTVESLEPSDSLRKPIDERESGIPEEFFRNPMLSQTKW